MLKRVILTLTALVLLVLSAGANGACTAYSSTHAGGFWYGACRAVDFLTFFMCAVFLLSIAAIWVWPIINKDDGDDEADDERVRGHENEQRM